MSAKRHHGGAGALVGGGLSMCDFCHKHGEGEKWYLQAKNYSQDLLADVRRRKFIEEFFLHPEHLATAVARVRRLDDVPAPVRSLIRWAVVAQQKNVHYGQVVPIEDIEKVLAFTTSVVRLPCICRHVTLGEGKRYCYAFTVGPHSTSMAAMLEGLHPSFVNGPNVGGLETLGKEEALQAFRAHEREGLCHTIWTFHTPFIGGVCNCDRTDCLAMKTTVTHDVPVMFRSEYVAAVSPGACNGCRLCMKSCQFGAMGYSAATRKAWIDPKRCYGCGICRAACQPQAIALSPRGSVPEAAGVW